jgi:hypothetical protein
MAFVVPRVAKYTFAKPIGPPSKDPVNLALIDMEDGLERVQSILVDLGFKDAGMTGRG